MSDGEYIHRKKLEAYKKWKIRRQRGLTLEEAKKVLREEGYVIVQLSERMRSRMDDCLNATNEDCMYCCVNVCLMKFV